MPVIRISDRTYERLKRQVRRPELLIDGPTGTITAGRKSGRMSPDSFSFRILTHLVMAFPQPVELLTLFLGIWGGEFDPQTDTPSLMSAIGRLRIFLGRFGGRVKVTGGLISEPTQFAIAFSGNWRAFL